MERRLLLVSVPLLALRGFGRAQEQQPTFQTGAMLVRLDVQVMLKNKPVTGLTATDFVVREEGAPQKIEYFGQESEPVQLLLVLDVSGSMHRILSEMAQVGQRSLGVLQEQDQVGVQFFARSSRLAIELTDDKLAAARLLKDALLEDSLGAGSSVYEALLAAADVLSEAPEARGRRAVLMLTDNGGLSYQLPATDVLKELYQVNAVVNAIVPEKTKEPAAPKPGEYRNPDFEPHNIFQIAAQTGGEVVRADNSGRFREIIEHIRMRYSLHYRPLPAPPGSFRRVQVELASETRRKYPKAEVLARAGYFAP